jgi:hypothetical protein
MGAAGTLPARALAAAGHPILACGRTPLAAITVTTETGSTHIRHDLSHRSAPTDTQHETT